jgi:outer membrane protein assembly factor BamB
MMKSMFVFVDPIIFNSSSVYTTATNYGNSTWTLVNGDQITWGAFSAINQQTGALVWQTPMPNQEISSVAPTVVGDIVLSGTQGANAGYTPGSLIAMNKATGAILLNVQLDVLFHGGISFANEYMLLGTGYQGSK